MPATPLAVTLGDPAGIGPEIIVEAWRRRTEGDHPFAVFAVECFPPHASER